jgi:hypothetical protein
MQRASAVFALVVLALAACGTKKAGPDGGAGGNGAPERRATGALERRGNGALERATGRWRDR